jgi:hypothetical protein
MNDEHDNAITDNEAITRFHETIEAEDRAAREWANARHSSTTQRRANSIAKKAFLAGVNWQKGRER